jgi:hypothetical protein
MANYLLAYYGGGMPESDEDKKKSMDDWGEWMKQCGDNLVDLGNPCSDSKSVTKDGVNEVSGDPITGYSVLKADSLDQAVKAAQMVPLVVDGTGRCDVYETFAAM